VGASFQLAQNLARAVCFSLIDAPLNASNRRGDIGSLRDAATHHVHALTGLDERLFSDWKMPERML
jgi:hypothetical protein